MLPGELGWILNAHGFMRVERPPNLWDPASELEPFVRLLGEMLSAGLVRNGGVLEELTLNVANVVVEPDAGDVPSGEYVAVTIRGRGDWTPETTWPRGSQTIVGDDLTTTAASAARAAYAYTRVLPEGEGSLTVLFDRAQG
jgi:hypothetical protein